MTAVLSHCGSQEMNRAQLAMIETPAPQGSRHRPVPHIELVETIDAVLGSNGIEIVNESFSFNEKNTNLFGVMDLVLRNELGGEDFTTSLGFRSSNMQKLPVAFVAGARVFVCDNLMFIGDYQVLKRKHTIGLDLLDEITEGIDRFLGIAHANLSVVSSLKERELTDLEAKEFVFDSFVEKIFPIKLFDDVVAEYWAPIPRHEEFAPRTAWSLVNAYTEVAKQLRPNPRNEALSRLAQYERQLIQ